YKAKDEVILFYNTLSPYHNRQETYPYFDFPFCHAIKTDDEHEQYYAQSFAEKLEGYDLEPSGMHIHFTENIPTKLVCQIKDLNEKDYKQFVKAILQNFWYQMYLDDLPIWGIVGEKDEYRNFYLWTHKKFDIGYNKDRIVDVNLTSENRFHILPGKDINFTYEVNWKKSDIEFEDRFTKYLDHAFFQHRIHWFSIFNSFMMVVFLVGLVSMILMRTLRKDYARYSKDDDLDDLEKDLGDEYGWKQIHGDVFRSVRHNTLFSSLIGSGFQLSCACFFLILFAILGELYTERASLLSTAIFLYSITSPLNGYVGTSLYTRFGGKKWVRQMIFSTFLFPSLVCGTAFFINFFSIYYHASKSIPFVSMLAVASICIFVIFPLNIIGAVLGKNISGQPHYPCRINAVPRPIPEKKWFMEPIFVITIGGILPFGSIFIEMYFVFTSFWAYKIYYVYGFMLLVLLILAVVIVCVTIVSTYFLLNAEDYRWQWTSFLTGSSTAGYVYLYAIYYYFFKTKMYGLFQTTFYFFYMFLFCAGLGIMCGSFAFLGTTAFVYKIYSTVKID
ncbi:unnamed protein product, partial [Gordionus sp. m RMFG-2023]